MPSIISAFTYYVFVSCAILTMPGNDMMLSSQLTDHSFSSMSLQYKIFFYGAGRALRSTPQPPYQFSSFAYHSLYGGFAGYLLLSLAQPHYHAVSFQTIRCSYLSNNSYLTSSISYLLSPIFCLLSSVSYLMSPI